MSVPYTPTTSQVRDAYIRKMRDAFIASDGEHGDEFDRWLEARDAAKWDEGWAAADINRPTSRKGHWDETTRKGFRTWIPDPKPTNPYRTVEGGN